MVSKFRYTKQPKNAKTIGMSAFIAHFTLSLSIYLFGKQICLNLFLYGYETPYFSHPKRGKGKQKYSHIL